ncbi:N4-gp56 family major capsid protein [Roseicitreum antarcticum]|uniref:Major capsid protein, N4-gp56 family n=2 Tax=Roseicitreum antarcticum TaxID=564137 RepID=A0A1H3E6F3_9RHOB|nr:N4-gp56 family major capsid protein [Roseicitreum antarcticum]SDX73838.1 major capsid protein, N4-gp56 family [Roseicitreum antarcticum]
MAQTIIPWGDPKAQKKWSSTLAVDVAAQSYWGRKFMGKGQNNIIEEKLEIASDAGDRVSFDLSVRLRQRPTAGDKRVKGKEENLRFYTDEVIIDQLRHPVSAGGRMSRKRTIHDMRKIAKDRLAEYWRTYLDELKFIYMSGARGMNEEFIEGEDYAGHADNPLRAPDSTHHLFGGSATAKGNITATDRMSRNLIERAETHARMIRSYDREATALMPVNIEGSDRFAVVMSKYQEHDLRVNDTEGWVKIQADASKAEGRNNPIFKGALGMIKDVVLHAHENAIRFNDFGAGANLPAARALFMGRQAGVIAYGTPGGMRYMWKEEMEDYDNEPTVVAGVIFGFSKTRFNNRDFGLISLDTHAAPPVGV